MPVEVTRHEHAAVEAGVVRSGRRGSRTCGSSRYHGEHSRLRARRRSRFSDLYGFGTVSVVPRPFRPTRYAHRRAPARTWSTRSTTILSPSTLRKIASSERQSAWQVAAAAQIGQWSSTNWNVPSVCSRQLCHVALARCAGRQGPRASRPASGAGKAPGDRGRGSRLPGAERRPFQALLAEYRPGGPQQLERQVGVPIGKATVSAARQPPVLLRPPALSPLKGGLDQSVRLEPAEMLACPGRRHAEGARRRRTPSAALAS